MKNRPLALQLPCSQDSEPSCVILNPESIIRLPNFGMCYKTNKCQITWGQHLVGMLSSRFCENMQAGAGLHFTSICFALIGPCNASIHYHHLLQQDRKQLSVLWSLGFGNETAGGRDDIHATSVLR